MEGKILEDFGKLSLAEWKREMSSSGAMLGAGAHVLVITLGLLSLFHALASLLHGVYAAFIRPQKPLKRTYSTSCAMVTGATDGIGLAIAKRLACNEKLDVLLVGRSQSKLDEAKAAVEKACAHRQNVYTQIVDFERSEETQWAALEASLETHDVGLVVHSAGASFPRAMYADEADMRLHFSLISINCSSSTRLLVAALTHMQKRKAGAIVNIGSGAGTCIPSDPLYSSYAASKAYLEKLTRSVHAEVGNTKLRKSVHVQLQAPLFVATKMSKIKKATALHPSADAYAAAAIRHIGYEAVTSPWWTHKLIWWAVSCLPERRMDTIRFQQSSSLRHKALKKLERENKERAATAGEANGSGDKSK